MASRRIIAIINAEIEQVRGIIDELGLDAKAKRVGRFVAVHGPFLDELGEDGVAEVARSKKLPLVEVRTVDAKAKRQPSHAAM